MNTVNQPSALPTNKLMVATAVGPVVTEVWAGVMAEILPALAGPEMSLFAGMIATLVVGYFVPDRPNVVG